MSHTGSKPSQPKGSGKLRKTISTLYDADIFKGIEPAELGIIFDDMEMQTYPAGTILFMPEDSSERLYILRECQVDLYLLTSGGKRLVTRRILPGSVFGMMGLLGHTMQGDFAETTEDSTVCMITREDVLALLRRQPDVVLHILEILGNRLHLLEERLMEAAYSPVIMRLAHFFPTY